MPANPRTVRGRSLSDRRSGKGRRLTRYFRRTRRNGRTPVEFGYIAAFGEVDPKRVIRVIVRIFEKLGPQSPRLAPDHRVGFRIVCRVTIEYVNAYDTLL